MGKFSVSISDELEVQLRKYADEHNEPISQVVAQALQGFFTPHPPPGPEPPPQPIPDLGQIQEYITTVAWSLEGVRRVLEALGLTGAPWPGGPALPPPLPCPPWETLGKWAAGRDSTHHETY